MHRPAGAASPPKKQKPRHPGVDAACSPARRPYRRWSGLGRGDGHCCGYLGAGRAAGSARWRMGACSLSRFGCGWRVGEGAGVCTSGPPCWGRFRRWSGLAVMRRHLVLRQAELVVVHLARPSGLGTGFRSLGGRLGRGGWQFGRGQRTHTDSAQRQQRRTENLRHGAKPHTCAGWPADGVAAASTAVGLALRCRGILPACTSSCQSSWCSLAHASLT